MKILYYLCILKSNNKISTIVDCIEILKQKIMKKLFNSFTTLIVLGYIIGISLATIIIYI